MSVRTCVRITNQSCIHLLLYLMCGIFFNLRHAQLDCAALCEALERVNGTRGPDSQSTKRSSLSGVILDFFASELRLRGSAPVVQPHEQDGHVLCWNGEVFEGMEIGEDENDGVKLFERLCATDTVEQLSDLFGSVEGPYAFVYYNSTTRQLFFARDPLGRRSLLIHKPSLENPYFLLASSSIGRDSRYDFQELGTEQIYCLEVGKLVDSNNLVDAFDSCLTGFGRGANTPYSQPPQICTALPPDNLPLLSSLESPGQFEHVVPEFIDALDGSVALRVRNIPKPSRLGAARLSVLFSGGIDSTVLAFFAHKYIPLDEPIDLLNVAFENPRKIKGQMDENLKQNANRQTTPPYMVPDRVTGLQEVEELRRLCPRQWNFVEVNVPYEESQAAQSQIEALMFPARTVMDLSLAMALFFASRAAGMIRDGAACVPYTSPARVLLNGLGADELLGGYSRHRSVYKTSGFKGLISELQLDIDRIPSRNLGRDDRVISSHGKETRHPFLSLSLVDFVAKLPVHLKLDPRAEAGVGDKALLRLAARRMGLVEASGRKKRAMQFGSHSARMEGERHGDALIRGT
ncbi:asparagine synthase-domain-containing protein [Mycena amicta]|nr:asparagine synthase-domain-containing protein [Mycena amicta]